MLCQEAIRRAQSAEATANPNPNPNPNQEAIRRAQSAEATAPRAEAGTTLDRRLQPYVAEAATVCAGAWPGMLTCYRPYCLTALLPYCLTDLLTY